MTLLFPCRLASVTCLLPVFLLLAACGGRESAVEDTEPESTRVEAPAPRDTAPPQTGQVRQVAPIDSAISLEITVDNTTPPFLLRFRPDWTVRRFDTIIVSQKGAEVQRLTGFRMEEGTVAETDDPLSYVAARDLNFDGHPDLQLTVGGSASSHIYCYWLFDPKARQFVVDETLKEEKGSPWINAKERTVMFHTNQGCGGRCYTRNTYNFNDSARRFVLVRQETQIATGVKPARNERKKGKGQEKDARVYYDDSPKSRYVRIIKAMKDGKLQVISRKTLSGGEAM